MHLSLLLLILGLLATVGFVLGRHRALGLVDKAAQLRSLPGYYGAYVLLWCALPSLLVLCLWLALDSGFVDRLLMSDLPAAVQQLPEEELALYIRDVKNLATGNVVSGQAGRELQLGADRYQGLLRTNLVSRSLVVLGLAVLGLFLGWRSIDLRLKAMNRVEAAAKWILMAGSTLAVFTTLGIILSLIFEAGRFFRLVPMGEFLFGLRWSPQLALRADQVGSSGSFGAVPLFAGTLLITVIAMLVAVPVGLLSAIYLAEYAGPRFRTFAKPLLEILAGVPTVVYGFFAALTVAPTLRRFGEGLGLEVASESALAAGAVMGIMIIPYVSSLSDDVISAVPRGLREASLGMGATQAETIRRVVFPAALPGIVGGILLAVSRAIGETMIVVMAAGLAANLTANPLEAVTTVTVQIVTLLVGDQEFDSAKTLAAFALGLMLFLVTLVLNVVALVVVRKYREQYE
ncbi:MAG: phosphate ABC transporter permease subunit PstC [Deltaproteobacteria bacterium]|nr:phosphate ABC transporter permease subunit PstC [Deltaproteobacteria bacterium]